MISHQEITAYIALLDGSLVDAFAFDKDADVFETDKVVFIAAEPFLGLITS